MKFPCPHCGQRLSAPEEWAGRESQCTNCSEPIIVPEPESVAASPPSAPGDPQDAPRTAAGEPPRPASIGAPRMAIKPQRRRGHGMWTNLLLPAILVAGAFVFACYALDVSPQELGRRLTAVLTASGEPASDAAPTPSPTPSPAPAVEPAATPKPEPDSIATSEEVSQPVAAREPASEHPPEPAAATGAASEAAAADPIAWLREHPNFWPPKIVLLESTDFSIVVGGKVAGSVRVPAGAAVQLAALDADNAVVAFENGRARVPIDDTDLRERVPAAMAGAAAAAEAASSARSAAIARAAADAAALEAARAERAGSAVAATESDDGGPASRGNTNWFGAASPGQSSKKMTFTLHVPEDASREIRDILDTIKASMDRAVQIYTEHTGIEKHLNVHYNPSVPTADGNINGTIRIGTQRNTRVCMHEICHTVGVGTHPNWSKLMVDNRWQGKRANRLLQEFTEDPDAQLSGDHMHFWPYGLNYDTEAKSDEDLIRHAKMVEAIVEDLERAR